MVAAFSVPSIRSLLAGGTPAGTTVGAGTQVTSPNWTYTVGSVRRVATIGNARARGTYLVVQVATTNRGAASAQLQPSSFAVTGADGQSYVAQPAASGVYSGAENPDSTYKWPTVFPVGRSVVVPLVFDVATSTNGLELAILEVPNTRIRLE
jgi:hypothetical protein